MNTNEISGTIEKRIESKTSRTAEFTCLVRAASFYEKKPQYNSNDWIATKLVPKFLLTATGNTAWSEPQ
jgi:hypothetical protein